MSKVFVLGATGQLGASVVEGLLEKNVSVTAYARDASKAEKMFAQSSNLNVVQGGYDDLDVFKAAVAGHERLFLMVQSFGNMRGIKYAFAKIAYEAGVKQIVDISCTQEMAPAWRSNPVCEEHRSCEEAVINIPNRGKFVALRPAFFFSNHFMGDIHSIRNADVIMGCNPPDEKKMWISPTDISALAVNALTEPIEHHNDCAYEMTSEALSGNERAQILSKVLGKDIKYVERSAAEEYKANRSVGMPHDTAYAFVEYFPQGQGHITRGLPILLGRDPESLEAWLEKNKQAFLQ
ncbi:hypothetical protein K450DRAFT_221568 [Umbelopsis ramanniana AG]|uniref:NmrA-like domain-containing protein n=1 Tax=Umbelopsis ramanniana AG TaxID=1314678 RepID=A0AAD5EHW1_UMBRA|nr:uncharacterized protein K450DRAFT_221568 [Umbelopsis ramanniana AG]KAI8583519.1 hypothetical protein K450DRAFT_221568 [Umbelopsis ramanniana AG]